MKTTLGGYPKIFNIESDPREEALQAGRQFRGETRPDAIGDFEVKRNGDVLWAEWVFPCPSVMTARMPALGRLLALVEQRHAVADSIEQRG